MRQRDVAALDAKYTKELADAKAENDALRDDVAAGEVVVASKQSVDRPAALGVDNTSLPRLADTAGRDYFLRERLITMQKQLEGTKYINEQYR